MRHIRGITAILGLAAAITCGWQLLWFIGWGFYGAPANPLHLIAMFGAIGMLLASFGLLPSKGRASFAALIVTTIPSYVFYGPALIFTSMAILRREDSLSEELIVMLVPPILLLLTTALAMIGFLRHR